MISGQVKPHMSISSRQTPLQRQWRRTMVGRGRHNLAQAHANNLKGIQPEGKLSRRKRKTEMSPPLLQVEVCKPVALNSALDIITFHPGLIGRHLKYRNGALLIGLLNLRCHIEPVCHHNWVWLVPGLTCFCAV